MRALLIVAAVVLAASLAGFSQSTASAAPPEAVSIQIFPTTFFPVEAGTWEASGAINDSGFYERTEARVTGSMPDCPFCPPEHTGTFKEVFVLSSFPSSEDTLTVKEEAQLTPSDDPFGTVTGVWQIESGTGVYDRASGHGTDQFFALPGLPLTLSLTGVISKAG